MKLMIVDDEPLEREVLTMMIRKQNLGVSRFFEAKNGAEAVNLAKKENINITIMDIKMPVMDGITAAEIMKKEVPDCRILFLTAYDQFDYALRSIQLRVDDYLLKPAHPDDIKKALEKLIPTTSDQAAPFVNRIDEHREIIKVVEYIDNHLSKELSLDFLSGLVHLNAQYLCRLFKQVTGYTMKQYITIRRLEKAKVLFQSSNDTITEISSKCGFADANYFARVFKKMEGITPTQYQQQVLATKVRRVSSFGKNLI